MPAKLEVQYVDHISIAVRDVKKAEAVFFQAFGWKVDGRYVDEGENIRVSYFKLGPTMLEIMEDIDGSGEVARFIKKHGEGVMVLSFKVDDCAASLDLLKRNGAKVVDDKPRLASELGRYFAFIHPKVCHGVLAEVIDGEY